MKVVGRTRSQTRTYVTPAQRDEQQAEEGQDLKEEVEESIKR